MTLSADDPALGLRQPAPGAAPGVCKVCGGEAALFGVTDFNRSCEEVRGNYLPLAGIPVYYRRCGRCGLIYTEAFDDWAHADFEARIYNADYAQVDPDYTDARPVQSASLIQRLLGAKAEGLSVLDYGGGNGALASHLRTAGYADVETYDAFHPDHRERPERQFDLVTCFETLEHMPDPMAGAADIASFIKADGLLLFSTLVQPADIAKQGAHWWYVGPRNGHVTLHTKASLATMWARGGLKFASFSDNIHVAFRTIPHFAAHAIQAS